MKTLNKTITRQFFKTESGFSDLEKSWKNWINNHKNPELKTEHYLLYQLLRGKDITKSFGEVTSPNKVNNGHTTKNTFFIKVHELKCNFNSVAQHEIFNDLIVDNFRSDFLSILTYNYEDPYLIRELVLA